MTETTGGGNAPEELAWRFPHADGWPLGRLIGVEGGRGLFWLTLAAPVFVFLALSPETRAWGVWCLLAYALAVVVLFARRLAAVVQEADVRLTPGGAAWRGPSGERFEIPRERIVGFHIDREETELENSASLTLLLDDGFESWPLEIGPPATEQTVREFLTERMGLAERPPDEADAHDANLARFAELWEQVKNLDPLEQEKRIDEAVAENARQLGFYAVADVEERTWRFEGTRSNLLELCRRWEKAADSLRVAPDYARPDRYELGGWAMAVVLEADEEAWLSPSVLCGPPAWHRNLAAEARRRLKASEEGDFAFDVPETRWRLRWIVREEDDASAATR